MSGWRLIALDLDGTLLNENSSISEENRTWIRKARSAGTEVTIATGRPFHHVKPIIDSLGLTVPYVTANGSEVWTHDNILLERHTLPSKTILFLHSLALEFDVKFWFSVADTVLKRGELPKNIDDYQWLKFGYSVLDQVKKSLLWDRLEKYGGLEVSSSGIHNIEINPGGISKASGLQTVCNYLSIRAGEVVCIGDGLNDIKMIEWAGMGIAMDNAPELVKEKASWVTAHYLNHGVARAIASLLQE